MVGHFNNLIHTFEFVLTCNQTLSPQTLFLKNYNSLVRVLNISLDGQLDISLPIAINCNEISQSVNESNQHRRFEFDLAPFHLSSKKNKLTVVGSDAAGLLWPSIENSFTVACVSLYDDVVDEPASNESSCSGTFCCETLIQNTLSNFVYLSSTNIFSNRPSDTCGYAFLVKDGAYSFSSKDLVVFFLLYKNILVKCAQTSSYLSDIDECKELSHDCFEGATCKNFPPGNYTCRCPHGHRGDGRKSGAKCTRKSNIIIIALSVSVSILTLIGGTFYVYWTSKKSKLMKLKEHFFQKNGGLLLQQELVRYSGSAEMTKIFTMEELKEATCYYDIFSCYSQLDISLPIAIDCQNHAKHCLRLKGEERPTMKEVATELEAISIVEKHRWEKVNFSSEETENLLKATPSYSFSVVDDADKRSLHSGSESLSRISLPLNGR
uniref:Wall-associated receptor kinase 2 n=1 Tax=Cajanus cajan TaxID=3821 RepID=A0A151U7G2_CAJCA|nr:Wall-associated receptor kinase 2 [Cajanus cajan]